MHYGAVIRSGCPQCYPLLMFPCHYPAAIGVPGTVKLCEAFVTREAPEAPDESVSRRRCTCSLINDSLAVDVDGEGDDADECDCECGCEGTDYDDADTHTPFLVLNMVLEKFGAPLSTCLKSAMARMRNDAAAAYTTLCMHMTEQFLRALVDVHGLRVAHRVRAVGFVPAVRSCGRPAAGACDWIAGFEAKQRVGGVRRV